MTDDLAALAGFDGQVRLFPLPNLVLFPHVVQGLHVFEPRYRQLMADALASDGTFALALLEPDWEDDYDGRPPINPVACLGRIGWHEKLADGRYNLRLRGLSRVRLVEEVATDRLYRVARADLIPDVAPADMARLKRLRKVLAEAAMPHFAGDATARRQVEDLFGGDLPLGHICDILAYGLPLPLEFKQALLSEPHVDIRAERMAEAMKASAVRAARRFPPDFSPN